jgi:hypothetical protein
MPGKNSHLYFLLVIDYSASMKMIYPCVQRQVIKALEVVLTGHRDALSCALIVFRGSGDVAVVNFDSNNLFTKDLRQLETALRGIDRRISGGGSDGAECVTKALDYAAGLIGQITTFNPENKTAILLVTEALDDKVGIESIGSIPHGLYCVLRNGSNVEAQCPFKEWIDRCNQRQGNYHAPKIVKLNYDDDIEDRIGKFLSNTMGKDLARLITGGSDLASVAAKGTA